PYQGDAAGQQPALGLLPAAACTGRCFAFFSRHSLLWTSFIQKFICSFIVSRTGQNGKRQPLPGPQNRTAGPGPAVRFSVYSTGSMVSMAWAGLQAAQS